MFIIYAVAKKYNFILQGKLNSVVQIPLPHYIFMFYNPSLTPT